MSETSTEQRLRQALDAAASGVRPRSDAYQRALHEWRRRERRRRLLGVLLAAVLLAAADAVGLWALNRSPAHDSVVYDAPPPAVAPAHPGPTAP